MNTLLHGLLVSLYGTGWDRLDWNRGSPYWVGQVGLGQGGLQIRWDRMGLGQVTFDLSSGTGLLQAT